MYRDDRNNGRSMQNTAMRECLLCKCRMNAERQGGCVGMTNDTCHRGEKNVCPSTESTCPYAEREERSSCAPDCQNGEDHLRWGLEGYPLASVYAPIQAFVNLYDCETAIIRGTIFAELDLPLNGKANTRGGMCHEESRC
jgi:hypothetical protein